MQFSTYRAVKNAVLQARRALAAFERHRRRRTVSRPRREARRSRRPIHPYSAAIDAVAPDAPRDELLWWLALDMHAGFFETTLAMHIAPTTVGEIRSSLPPCPDIKPVGALERAPRVARGLGRERLARELEFGAIAWTNDRPFTATRVAQPLA